MIVTIHIRRNADGVIREIHNEPPSAYWWLEGNCRCDCNRHLFFERAAGRDPDPESDDVPCGETLYSIRAMNGGVVDFQDSDW